MLKKIYYKLTREILEILEKINLNMIKNKKSSEEQLLVIENVSKDIFLEMKELKESIIIINNELTQIKINTNKIKKELVIRFEKIDERIDSLHEIQHITEIDKKLISNRKKTINLLKNEINNLDKKSMSKFNGIEKIIRHIHRNTTSINDLYSEERQVQTNFKDIRADHIGRYKYVCEDIPLNKMKQRVLDIACGIGYGSKIISENNNIENIDSVDLSESALSHGREYFNDKKINYICQDCRNYTSQYLYDIIISFETIEHITEPELLIKNVYNLLKNDGLFYISFPNQNKLPFDPNKFLFHNRHFTYREMKELLYKYKFKVVEIKSQNDKNSETLIEGEEGLFILLKCEKNKMDNYNEEV